MVIEDQGVDVEWVMECEQIVVGDYGDYGVGVFDVFVCVGYCFEDVFGVEVDG